MTTPRDKLSVMDTLQMMKDTDDTNDCVSTSVFEKRFLAMPPMNDFREEVGLFNAVAQLLNGLGYNGDVTQGNLRRFVSQYFFDLEKAVENGIVKPNTPDSLQSDIWQLLAENKDLDYLGNVYGEKKHRTAVIKKGVKARTEDIGAMAAVLKTVIDVYVSFETYDGLLLGYNKYRFDGTRNIIPIGNTFGSNLNPDKIPLLNLLVQDANTGSVQALIPRSGYFTYMP